MRKSFLFANLVLWLMLLTSVATAQTSVSQGVSTYFDMKKATRDAFDEQDFRIAYDVFRTMDSLYGINDFVDLMYFSSLANFFEPNREAYKALLLRLARHKCCDLAYLGDFARNYMYDTLDCWNEIVAIVSPRGYQDTVYQNLLLALKRADQAYRWTHYVDNDTSWLALRAVDSTNLIVLKKLIAERGFPTYTKVGRLSVDHASVVVQHQPADFQHWYLQQARAAADTGDYSADWIADMTSHNIARHDWSIIYDTIFLERILKIVKSDQDVRHLLDKGLDEDSVRNVVREVDSLNLIELKLLIAERGFPTLSGKGFYCCDFASLIAQHSPPEFLHWFLEQAKVAADSSDFVTSWIAYMTDRDLNYRNKPQRYGTQGFVHDGLTGFNQIEDVERLNERREKNDMEPIEKYAPKIGITDFYIHPSLVDYKQYSLNCSVDGDTLRVSGFMLYPYDTTTYFGQPIKVDTVYSLPLSDYRTADGAIVLRREGNWYPHRDGELLTAQVHIEADGYYVIGGTEWSPSFDIHLILLPKDKYSCKVVDTPVRPFHFYRLASDTTAYPEAFYNEFVDSYSFFCTFFGDTLTAKPMNIVEIGDPEFVMCQSLRDMIIFGHYFYNVYTMISNHSWIPHEMAHQWWGNRLFFEYRDYALSESLTEYLKLQFLKSRHRGYDEQMDYYRSVMELVGRHLSVADIRSVETQDESIAIYSAAPYRLEQQDALTVANALKQLYHNHKHTLVTRDGFQRECSTVWSWLR